MTHSETPLKRATAHLEAIDTYAENLREEYAKARPDLDTVRFLNASIGRGLKLAEVHALLNIGEQLDRLATRLEDDDLLDLRGDAGQIDRLLTARPSFAEAVAAHNASLSETAGQ